MEGKVVIGLKELNDLVMAAGARPANDVFGVITAVQRSVEENSRVLADLNSKVAELETSLKATEDAVEVVGQE